MSKLGFVRIPANSYRGMIKDVLKNEIYQNLSEVFCFEICKDDLFNKGVDVKYIDITMIDEYSYGYFIIIDEDETIETWLQKNTI